MKLGSQTNSVMNHLYSRGVIGEPVPVVGMGATLLLWTDRHACTITCVQYKGDKTIVTVKQDRVSVSGDGETLYGPNPNAREQHFRRDENGWVSVRLNQSTGRWCMLRGNGLRIGERDEYRDPSF